MEKLHFHTGVMGSAKTANLMISVYNLRSQGKNVEIIRPAIDTRGTPGKITSRLNGLQPLDAIDLADLSEFRLIPGTEYVFVEEFQLFKSGGISNLIKMALYNGVKVNCYGLKYDSNGKFFDATKTLLEADPVEHIFQLNCQMPHCTNDATHHLRFAPDHTIIREANSIQIGDHVPKGKKPANTKKPYFKSVCFECFFRNYYANGYGK